MGRVGDILERFRPAGAPGAATIAGVPADRIAELSAELEPVFALLVDVEAECADIRRSADEAAVLRRQAATAQAGQIVAEARRQSASVRAEVAAEASRVVRREGLAAATAAEAEAARIGREAERLLPEFTQRVVERVRCLGQPGTVRLTKASGR